MDILSKVNFSKQVEPFMCKKVIGKRAISSMVYNAQWKEYSDNYKRELFAF